MSNENEVHEKRINTMNNFIKEADLAISVIKKINEVVSTIYENSAVKQSIYKLTKNRK